VLTAGYQVTPPLASSEVFPARRKLERRGRLGPLERMSPAARRCAKNRRQIPTKIAPSPLS